MGRKPSAQRKKLTAAQVQNAKGPGKFYDENGLFLRVTAGGSKHWVQRVTLNGSQREIGLGSASVVSLAEARELARENKRLAAEGVNPVLERKRRAGVPTFDEAVDRVFEIHRATWRNPKHAAQFLATLRTYVSPVFGTRKISEVTSADVMEALLPIWLSKAETARRLKQRIGLVMTWAVAERYRADDPTNGIEKALPRAKRTVRHRKALHYDEVAGCIAAVQASKASPSTKLAVEFLILAAARSGEVRLASWGEMDLERQIWTVPHQRMKGGVEHVVPLSGRALEILKAARELHDGDLVFPGARAGRPMSDMTMSKLIKELGFEADVHGFRTSFRTWLQERTSASFELAEKCLAHKIRNPVAAAYARSDLLAQRRTLMQRWADHLAKTDGQIVRIGGAA